MYIKRELVEMTDPYLPIKTYLVDSASRNLSASPHIHEELEMIYMTKGSMEFHIGLDRVKVNEGQTILINSLTVHSSRVCHDTVTEFCLLQFNPALVYNMGMLADYKYLTPFIQQGILNWHLFDSSRFSCQAELVKLQFEILSEFNQKNIAYEISVKSCLYKILTILYRNSILSFNPINNMKRQQDLFGKLQKVLQFIEHNYAEDITVSQACDLLNINYHYFCRLFKEATGKSFIQYLNFVRISVAERLLLTTDKPITDIICETGFSSLSYFNRTFKELKGLSPSGYRKKHRQEHLKRNM